MSVAVLSSMRSKDPSTQVGAVIIDEKKRIIGIGYNGFPSGISDDDLPWTKTASHAQETKYPYVCHAELNALLNRNGASGCTIYSSLFPCHECTKLIIQAGIQEIVYLSDKHGGTPSCIASRKMLDLSGIKYRPLQTDVDGVSITVPEAPRIRTADIVFSTSTCLVAVLVVTVCMLNWRGFSR